jgi:hypothetical protein
MIKVEEFRGRIHDHPTPAMKLEQFLKKEKIARQDIISINYSSDQGPNNEYCSILLTYEKESK